MEEQPIFSNEGENCPIAALAYFLPGVSQDLFKRALLKFRGEDGHSLLELHDVLDFYVAELSLPVEHLPAPIKITASSFESGRPGLLLEIARHKRGRYKDTRVRFYPEVMADYRLDGVLYHDGFACDDGHFRAKRRGREGWLACDGADVQPAVLEDGSREAVMLWYTRMM